MMGSGSTVPQRASVAVAVLVLVSVLVWVLGDAPRARAARTGVAGTASAAPREPSSLELARAPTATGGATELPSQRVAQAVAREAVEPADSGTRLRLVCAQTGKPVPAFGLRLINGAEEHRLVTDVAGRARLPATKFGANWWIENDNSDSGYHRGRFRCGAGTPEVEDVERLELVKGDDSPVVLRVTGLSFVLVELDGVALLPDEVPYGTFADRKQLGPRLVLGIEGAYRGAGPPTEFELYWNRPERLQWHARGPLDRFEGRLVAERVVARVAPRASLHLDVNDRHGKNFSDPARFTLRRLKGSPEQEQEREQVYENSWILFDDLEPGRYAVEGASAGFRFGPREVDLGAFEYRQLALTAVAEEHATHSLELELHAGEVPGLASSSLPAEIRLLEVDEALRLSMGRVERSYAPVRGAPAAALRIEWTPEGLGWLGRVRVEGLAPGEYRLGIDPPGPAADEVARALDRLLLPAGTAERFPVVAGGLLQDLRLYEDRLVRLDLELEQTELVELRIDWDPTRPELALELGPALARLGFWSSLAQQREAGRLRGLFVWGRTEWPAWTAPTGWSGGSSTRLYQGSFANLRWGGLRTQCDLEAREPFLRPEPNVLALRYELLKRSGG